MLSSKVIEITVKHYLLLSLLEVERSLEQWLGIEWETSPYKDILTPYLIQRKLELNEAEY